MQNSLDNRTTVKDEDVDHHKNTNIKILSRTTIPNLGKNRSSSTPKIEHSKDKELINSGLHKLVSSFNSANKVSQKASRISTNRSRVHTSASTCENQPDSHIPLTKQVSIDKYTMTDFKAAREKKVDIEGTALGKQPYSGQGRDLQWTDPRLLKKYSLMNQPCKKAVTIPVVNKSDYESDMTEQEPEEDDEDDKSSLDFICVEDRQFLFRCIYYVCTTSVSFIGGMCGITLITLILWKLCDESIFNILLESPRHDLFFKRHLTNLAASILYFLNGLFGKIARLLTMSTSEVFAREEEGAAWYRSYIRY